MTNKHQVKPAKPAAVELNDAALDRAAGGGNGCVYTVTFGGTFAGTGSGGAWKTTDQPRT